MPISTPSSSEPEQVQDIKDYLEQKFPSNGELQPPTHAAFLNLHHFRSYVPYASYEDIESLKELSGKALLDKFEEIGIELRKKSDLDGLSKESAVRPSGIEVTPYYRIYEQLINAYRSKIACDIKPSESSAEQSEYIAPKYVSILHPSNIVTEADYDDGDTAFSSHLQERMETTPYRVRRVVAPEKFIALIELSQDPEAQKKALDDLVAELMLRPTFNGYPDPDAVEAALRISISQIKVEST